LGLSLFGAAAFLPGEGKAWESMTIIAMPPSGLLKQIAIFRLRSFNPSPLQPIKKVKKHHRPKRGRHDHDEC
jgi:hypothetical protein